MRSHRVVLALAAALAMSPVRQSATAAEVYSAAYQRGGLETFSGPELIASGHHFFGTASKGLALTVEEAVRRWGEPNSYIVGQEVSTAEQIGRMRRSKIPSRDWRGPGERSLFSLGVRGRSSEQLGAGVYLSGADSSRHSSPKCARGA